MDRVGRVASGYNQGPFNSGRLEAYRLKEILESARTIAARVGNVILVSLLLVERQRHCHSILACSLCPQAQMTVHPGNRDRTFTRSGMQLEILVYPASVHDLDTLADVLALSFHPRVGLQGLVWPVLRLGIREDIRRRLLGNNPKYCCLGAWIDDELVGTLEIGMRRTSASRSTNPEEKSRSPYIANLAVLPDWRRKGIASKLLLGAEGVAASWGSDRIFLHVLETNKAAQRLYLNAGFRIQGRSANAWNYLGAAREILLYKSFAD